MVPQTEQEVRAEIEKPLNAAEWLARGADKASIRSVREVANHERHVKSSDELTSPIQMRYGQLDHGFRAKRDARVKNYAHTTRQ